MAKPKMCSGSRDMEMIASPKDAPKYVRCPKCGRRVKPRLYDCHYHIGATPCWHYYIPPHKIKEWWKKKNK